MPVEPMIDLPFAMNAPSTVFAPFWRLCLHYWVNNCEPLPESEAELHTIARAMTVIWVRHKTSILEAFRLVQPRLDAAYRQRAGGENGLANARLRASLALRQRHAKADNNKPYSGHNSPREAAINAGMISQGESYAASKTPDQLSRAALHAATKAGLQPNPTPPAQAKRTGMKDAFPL